MPGKVISFLTNHCELCSMFPAGILVHISCFFYNVLAPLVKWKVVSNGRLCQDWEDRRRFTIFVVIYPLWSTNCTPITFKQPCQIWPTISNILVYQRITSLQKYLMNFHTTGCHIGCKTAVMHCLSLSYCVCHCIFPPFFTFLSLFLIICINCILAFWTPDRF